MDTILIVEDEADIADLVKYHLEKEGLSARTVADGKQALDLIVRDHPSLIILDLMLPGADGLEVCRRLRANSATQGIPIIMLTAKAEEVDRVLGLEMGADDYVPKPFSPRELVARVKAVLRRSTAPVTPSEAPVSRRAPSSGPDPPRGDPGGSAHRALGHGIPPAGVLPAPPGPRVHPNAVTRPGVGSGPLRRASDGGRSHPPACGKRWRKTPAIRRWS